MEFGMVGRPSRCRLPSLSIKMCFLNWTWFPATTG